MTPNVDPHLHQMYPVAIVGGGPVGLTLSLLLSKHGIRHILFERHPDTSIHPKAVGLNQRTIEVFRWLGLEDQIYAAAAPSDTCSKTGWYTSFGGKTDLHGRRIAVRDAWEGGSYREEYEAASPSRYSMLPQIRLEPLLKKAAEHESNATLLWNSPVTGIAEDPEGVTLTVSNGDDHRTFRAQYVVGADGGRFMADALGIPMEGPRDLVDMVTAHFSADLSPYLLDKECLINWFVNPDFGGSIGSGYLYHLGPWDEDGNSKEWVFASGFAADDPERFDPDLMVQRIHRSLGLPDLEIEVHSLSHWYVQAVVAERFRQGRCFLAGDAAHRIPPWGALGLNTGIQDVHNLAWKLSMALSSPSLTSLLDTYESERRPIAVHVAERSLSNFQHHGGVVDAALGLTPSLAPDEGWDQLKVLYSDSDEGRAKQKSIEEAMSVLDEEFHAHGVENGYMYAAGAVVSPDETDSPIPEDRLNYQPSSAPGHRIPHSWLQKPDGTRTSTVDLAAANRFILIVDDAGDKWAQAQQLIQHSLGKVIDIISVGAKGEWVPSDTTWEQIRGVSASGAILLRPDSVIAWRSETLPDDPTHALESALTSLVAAEDSIASSVGTGS